MNSPQAAAPRLSLIAAVAANGVIGDRNDLPWHLPEDLKHFRALTMGHPIIMGRRTWQSLGRPLPGRRSLVVSRDPAFRAEGAEVFPSLEAALAAAASATEVFVIGGAALYRTALPQADRLYITEIRRDFAGDTRFPEYDRGAWRESARECQRSSQGFDYDFVIYDRASTTQST